MDMSKVVDIAVLVWCAWLVGLVAVYTWKYWR